MLSSLIRSAILVCVGVILCFESFFGALPGRSPDSRVRADTVYGGIRSVFSVETPERATPFKKSGKSIKNARLLQGVVGTVLGDGAQSLAGKLHADVTAASAVELRNPNTLLLKVGVNGAVDGLCDVTTDTALLLGKTGTMNTAAFVRLGKCDIADSGHKIVCG